MAAVFLISRISNGIIRTELPPEAAAELLPDALPDPRPDLAGRSAFSLIF
jgi:hypothetical protein